MMVAMLITEDADILSLMEALREMQKPVEVTIHRKAKTPAQIRYAHHLIRCIAAHGKQDFETVKEDAKSKWGVVSVYTSLIDGERAARLKSFGEYEKAEMMAFIAQAEAFCCERQIDFIPARDSILRGLRH